MLSAIAKYIFGGILHETQEETVPLETKEVNDWLLVNMPYQTLEDLETEDDILTSVPQLMMQDCDKSFDYLNTASYCDIAPTNISQALEPTFLSECVEDFQILPESMYLNHSLYYPQDFSLVASQCFGSLTCSAVINSDKSVVVIQDKQPKSKSKTVVIQLSTRKNEVRKEPSKKVNHHSELTKEYFNHKIPVLSAKADLLERIKEIKPVQQAIEYDMKKHNSRGNLNRQNKTLIYEASAKSNRRKNLCRQPSGANNNRRCQN